MTLGACPTAESVGIAVDSSNVYFTCPADGLVQKVPIGGGTVIPIASGENRAHGIALDCDFVYWTTDHTSDGFVRRIRKQGGTVETLATMQAEPLGIALDATSVYWVNRRGAA